LDVQAMSLYNHVSSKADLLDGIAEMVFEQVELPDPDLAWPEQVRAVALGMYRAFSRHPAVAVALVTDQANPISTRALEPFDRLVGALYQAGFDDKGARQAQRAVWSLVIGSLSLSTGGFIGDPTRNAGETSTGAYLSRINPARLPNVSRLLQHGTAGDLSPQEDFEQALDVLMRGLVDRSGQR
jgi:TetR/AcrR family transcriptional regulator, tetracycline repressor protein